METLKYSRSGEAKLLAGLAARMKGGQPLRWLALGGDSGLRAHLAQQLADAQGLGYTRFDLTRLPARTPADARRGISSLSRLLSFARSQPSVLFFDEADALFGKRSKLSAAQGHYASYLLTSLRRMPGGVVLGLADEPAAALAKAVPLGVSLGVAQGVVQGMAEAVGSAQSTAASVADGLLPSHRFAVKIGGEDIGFCAVRGLGIEGGPLSGAGFDSRTADPTGGKLDASDLALWPTLILRRALEVEAKRARLLYEWRRAVLLGKPALRDVEIVQLDAEGRLPVHRWQLTGCWPKRWSGPQLDALDAGVSCEEIELYYREVIWR